MSQQPPFSRQTVSAAFSKAASHYDAHAFCQREIGNRLLERLTLFPQCPQRILDIGSGTGHFTRQLQNAYKESEITGVDLAYGMCQIAKSNNQTQNNPKYLCADAAKLPFPRRSMDLIVSNLTLQWCFPIESTMQALYDVLKPEGEIFFATLGPQTLHECRKSFSGVDDSQHVHPFYELISVGNAMLNAGFQEPVVDRELLTITYADLMSLFKDLKGTGVQNKLSNRKQGCLSRKQLQKVLSNYEALRLPDGMYPLTFEVIYGHARKPALHRHRQDPDGLVRIAADHIPVL